MDQRDQVKNILGKVWRVQYRVVGDASIDKLYNAVQNGTSLDELLNSAKGGSSFDLKSAWELLYQAVGLTVNLLVLSKAWKQRHNRPPSREELLQQIKEVRIESSYSHVILEKLDTLIEQVLNNEKD